MMIATEIAEAVQADRKGRWFDEFTKSGLECVLANDHHNGLVEKFYENNIEGTVESELADICIRIFDFLGVKGEHINGDIITSQYNIINFRCSSFTENAFKISNMIFEDEILDDNLRATFLSSTLRYMFQWAEAVVVNGNQVAVWHKGIPHPVTVRYGWDDNPVHANLRNMAGLPASPFQISLGGQ